jgi:F0F1-type ATP synthase assembly protein I
MSDQIPNFQDNDRRVRAVGTAATLGFSMVSSLVVLIGGGVWLDNWRDTSPVFTLIGVALGLVAAGYQLYELALLGRPERENGPLGKMLERRTTKTPRH